MRSRLIGGLVWIAFGATPGIGAAAAIAATEGSPSLEEIIVTAEKRSGNIQKTAVSVTTLNGQDLVAQGRTASIKDILRDVPGVFVIPPFASGAGGDPTAIPSDNPATHITIRGVPSSGGIVGVSGQASAAYYVDGIYNGLAGDFDINRVEVLRGPQGTLYGRSATSGVVSVITTDPELDEFSGDVTTEVGSDQLYHGQGAVNLPIGDNLAVRISAKHFQQDGPVVSSEGYKQKKQTVRAKLLYQPNENFSALVGYAFRDDQDNSGGAAMFSEVNEPDHFYVESGIPIFETTTRQRQTWAQFNLNLGIGTLTYIPAYRTYETSGIVNAFSGFIEQHGGTPDNKFVTHELRLTSPEASTLKWVVGGMSFRNRLSSDIFSIWAGSRAMVFHQVVDRIVTDTGLFAEATYPVAPTWRVTAGLRHDKSEVQMNETYTSNAAMISEGDWPGSPTWMLPEIPVVGQISGKEGNRQFENVTYKLRLEKDLTPDNMLYGMISTGFLPGDVNVNSDSTGIVVLEMDQQEVRSYEIGSKNRFLDNRLQLNGAAFYYDYSGYQQVQTINPVTQTDFRVLTSPARMWGLELEANYLVTENDRIDFAFGHTNAEFVDKPDIPGVNPFASFVAQTKIPSIVPTNVSLGYNHTFSLPNGSILDFYNQLRYAAGYDQAALTAAQLSGGAKPFVHEGNTWQWDARLGWTSPGGKFSTTVYANNLADKVYKQGAALLNPSEPWQSTHATTAPRTIGLVLNVKF